jgi:hypothetical protein
MLSDGFQSIMAKGQEIWDWLSGKLGPFYDEHIAPIVATVSGAWDGLKGAFTGFLSTIWDSLQAFPDTLTTVVDLFRGTGPFEGMSIGDRLDFVMDALPSPLSYIVDLFRGEGMFAPGLTIGDRFNLFLDDLPFPFSYIVDLFRGEGAFAGFSLKDRVFLALDKLPAPFGIVVDFFQGEGAFAGMSLKDRLNLVIPDLPAPFGTVVDFMLGNPPFENMSIKERFNFALDNLPEPFKSIIDWVKGDLSFSDMITNTTTALNDMAESFLGGLWDKLPDWLKDFINWMKEGVMGAVGGAGETVGGWWDAAKGAVGYQHGGIASGPMSGYPVMLHGTEAIVPLGGGRGRGSGLGNNFNMTFNLSGMTDRTDKRALAREISSLIQSEMSRSVGGSTMRGARA